MVQWFKNLFKTKQERELEFNRGLLNEQMHNLSRKLYDFREDVAYAIVKELLQLSVNYSVLEFSKAKDATDLGYLRGRNAALSDFIGYLDRAIEERKAEAKGEKPQVRGAIKGMSNVGISL